MEVVCTKDQWLPKEAGIESPKIKVFLEGILRIEVFIVGLHLLMGGSTLLGASNLLVMKLVVAKDQWLPIEASIESPKIKVLLDWKLQTICRLHYGKLYLLGSLYHQLFVVMEVVCTKDQWLPRRLALEALK